MAEMTSNGHVAIPQLRSWRAEVPARKTVARPVDASQQVSARLAGSHPAWSDDRESGAIGADRVHVP